jgi:hypothetical protein
MASCCVPDQYVCLSYVFLTSGMLCQVVAVHTCTGPVRRVWMSGPPLSPGWQMTTSWALVLTQVTLMTWHVTCSRCEEMCDGRPSESLDMTFSMVVLSWWSISRVAFSKRKVYGSHGWLQHATVTLMLPTDVTPATHPPIPTHPPVALHRAPSQA